MKWDTTVTTEHSRARRLVRGGGLLGAALSALAAVWLTLAGLEAMALVSAPRAIANAGVSGTFTDTTVSDFTTGAALTGTSVANANGGELRLRATLEDYFQAGSTISTAVWLSGTTTSGLNTGITPTINGAGEVVLNGSYLRSQSAFTGGVGSGRFLEARARLREGLPSAPFSLLGYAQEAAPGATTPDSQSRVFVVDASPDDLVIRGRDGAALAGESNIVNPDLALFHTFLIEWYPNEAQFYIDDTFTGTISSTEALTSWVWLDAFENTANGFSQSYVDWVRAGYYTSSGEYVSNVRDAGGVVNWTTLVSATTQPENTALAIETRTSVTGSAWSAWQPLTGTQINSPSGRYFQYRVLFTTSTTARSPEVSQVVVNYFGPSTVQVGNVTLDPGATQQFTAQAYDANNNPVSSLNYGWQVMNGGGVINSSGLFTAQLAAGTFTNTISATVQTTGGPIFGTASVTVRDLPPSANANGPYAVNEGAVITLTAGGADPNGTAVTFAWDLDNNGSFETAGTTPSTTFFDNGQYTLNLRATDATGLTATTTTTVTVNNVAPTITQVTNGGVGQPNQPVTVTVTATDPAGANDPLQYQFDCDNNGTYEISQANNTASCTFTGVGDYTVPVRVTDGDGGAVVGSTLIAIRLRVFLPLVVR